MKSRVFGRGSRGTRTQRRGWMLRGEMGKYSHLNAVITEHTHTRVGCAQINTNSGSHGDCLVW